MPHQETSSYFILAFNPISAFSNKLQRLPQVAYTVGGGRERCGVAKLKGNMSEFGALIVS